MIKLENGERVIKSREKHGTLTGNNKISLAKTEL